ncbi:hypothetical protein D3C83_182530 [compost metagenome]
MNQLYDKRYYDLSLTQSAYLTVDNLQDKYPVPALTVYYSLLEVYPSRYYR